jgi:hypothetical protein
MDGGAVVVVTFGADIIAQDTIADAGVALSVVSIETTLTALNVEEILTASISSQILEVNL